MSLAEEQPITRSLRIFTINDLARGLWEHVEPLLQAACEASHGEYTPERVLAEMGAHDGIERLRMIGICDETRIIAAAWVSIVREDDALVMLHLLASGDDAAMWAGFDDDLDAWAASLGVSLHRIPRGRKGWAKRLPHWKLRGTFVTLERKI